MKRLLISFAVIALVMTSLVGCTTKKETVKEIVILNYESSTAYSLVQKIIQDIRPLFAEYGYAIKMESVPFATKLDLAKAGDYEVTFAGWGPDYDWPTTYLDMWKSNNTYNEVGYKSAAYDTLMNPAGKTPEKIWTDLQDAEKVLLNDAYVIPIYQRAGISLQKANLHEVYTHLSGYTSSFKWAYKDNNLPIKLLETEVIPTMDPTEATDTVSFLSLGNTEEGLVMQNKTGSDVIPGVAKSWSYDEATKTWTFVLNPDSKWVDSNGVVQRAVKAQDFVTSWDRLKASKTAQYTFLMADVAKIASYKAVDDTHFTVTVTEKVPYFLNNMAFPSFYPIASENVASADFGKVNTAQWYNGAFYMSTRSETNVVWTKNANYWDAATVKAPSVQFRVIEQYDPATGIELYNNGDIDRVGLVGDFVTKYQTSPEAIVVPDTSVFYLMINVANGGIQANGPKITPAAGNPLFDNLKIRQAIALAIDKSYLTSKILKNGSLPAFGLVPANYLSSNGVMYESKRLKEAGAGYLVTDAAKAKTLLAEGMAELKIAKVKAAE